MKIERANLKEVSELEPLVKETISDIEEGPGVSFRSIEDIKKYFSDEALLEEFRKVTSELRKLDIEISPYRGGKNFWIECKYNKEDIGYFQPRRRYFNCQIYDEENEKYI